MASNTGGTPPFQLGCGNMPQTSIGSNSTNDAYIPKAKLNNRHHHNIHQALIKPALKKTATVHAISKTKLKHITKNNIVVTKTEKLKKTRYHHPK
jgi:hypothetical protein